MNLDAAQKLTSNTFSTTYAEARAKFLDAAPHARQYPCSADGPDGEALFTDAAYWGPSDAKNVLVIVSATHGPEGYCGSAAQLLFAKSSLLSQYSDTGVLLVHALNCYGFAWDRKVTAEGCDLNRNFIDFTEPLPSNPGYDELADFLVPEDISEEGLKRAEAGIDAYRTKHGEWKFQEARKSGQYTRAGGMFYGGMAPSEARLTLERIVMDFRIDKRERVIIIDYHTGLGPYGYGELQCEQASGLDGYERAATIFGPSVTSPDLGTSSSVIIRGSQDDYWERCLRDRHTYVCLEFGTYSSDNARQAQRNDHWLFAHRRAEINSQLGKQIREAHKLHYYPQDMADWKEMVLWRAHQVHRQAMIALAA